MTQTARIALSELAVGQIFAARTLVESLAIDGHDRPDEYATATARLAAAQKVLEAPVVNEFTWPAKVTDVPDAIAREAARRGSLDQARDVAREAAELAAGQSLACLRDWLREGLDRLDAKFRDAARAFLAASVAAPRRLHGRDDQHQVASFLARNDAAEILDECVLRRKAVGNALREPGSDNGIWLFAAWPTDRTDHNVDDTDFVFGEVQVDDDRQDLLRAVTRQYADRAWDAREPVERWHDLLALIVPSIAPYDAVAERGDKWQISINQAPAVAELTQLGQHQRQMTEPGRIAEQFNRRIAAPAA